MSPPELTRWIAPGLFVAGLVLLAPWLQQGLQAGPWQRLTQSGPWLPWAAAAGLLVSHALRALRLYAEWHARCGVGWAECLRVSVLHSAAVNLLPMRSGELGFPVMVARRWGVRLGDAVASLVWMRVQDMVVLAWLATLSALAVATGAGRLPVPAAGALALAVTGGLLRAVGRPGRPPGIRARSGNEPAGGLRARVQAARRAWGRARRAATPGTWACCVANWTLKLGTLGALMAALLDQRVLAAWCGALAGEFAAGLPVQATAGFGSYEAAVALGLHLAQAKPPLPSALAAALVVHLLLLAVTLAAAALALAHDRMHARRADTPAAPRPDVHEGQRWTSP